MAGWGGDTWRGRRKKKENYMLSYMEVPGANFYFVFVDHLSPWGFILTKNPKDHCNHNV